MATTTKITSEAHSRLARALGVPDAFPWQLALLDRMLAGDLPSVVDVPTGLGKTAVMVIWLVARAAGAQVPRRLVYVVDRRAVVDQATTVAEGLRELVKQDPELRAALYIDAHQSLPISTLRGQFLDNRKWLEDPSAPAIVLGTVDMVGSRLLFEGYGVSQRMRPYHAGLLGADTLLVLDEAHLVPPFEHLIQAIAGRAAMGLGTREPALNALVPELRLLSLSATSRAAPGALTLTDQDRAHPVVARRLAARKQLALRPEVSAGELPEQLASEAWRLAEAGARPIRCIVFCDRRDDARLVAELLAKRVGKSTPADIELFVGGRRIWERTEAAAWLRERGFLAGTARAPDRPVFVIATSAGEVGVDLDADHMVSDLVAWERMVQRLGRVNRRGDGDAQVIVVPALRDDEELAVRSAAASEVIGALPAAAGDTFDASPGALTELKRRAATDEDLRAQIARGSTPEPLYPALTRPLVEAWSMTSLEEHTGRPEPGPWLRGWIPDEEAQTTLVWREELPVRSQGQPIERDGATIEREGAAGRRRVRPLEGEDLETFLEAGGPQLAEQLDTETWRVVKWLGARCQHLAGGNTPSDSEQREPTQGASAQVAPDAEETAVLGPTRRPLLRTDILGVVVAGPGAPWSFTAFALSTKEQRDELELRLRSGTVLVDVRLGGLDRGLLTEESDAASDVTTLSQGDAPALPIRIQRIQARTHQGAATDPAAREGWRQEAQIATDHSAAGDEIEWLVIESLGTAPATSEQGRSLGAKKEQKLVEHEEWAEAAALRIAERLGLPPPYAVLLALAARLHDEGKRAKRWQQAFHAPRGDAYAKTRGRPNLQILNGYRHELGSLPYAERDPRVQALAPDLRDLCLHLIAAHHGNARPLLRTDGAEEPPSKLEERAQEIALRFARLEKRWGPWGLAWWEALLRAADQQASRQNDEGAQGG